MNVVSLATEKRYDQWNRREQYHTEYDILQVFNEVGKSVTEEMPCHYHNNHPNGSTQNIENEKFFEIDVGHSCQNGYESANNW